MKIAILSDIHGNHIALDAVLREAEREEVEKLFILGDLVGYYYYPEKVMELLDSWPKEMIQGNHEFMLSEALNDTKRAEEIRLKYGSGIYYALNKLSREMLEYLINLPVRKRISESGLNFELCHGSPWDRDCYIYPDAGYDVLKKCLISKTDFVFMGHTHYPFIFSDDSTVVANVGSVGQSRYKGGLASWAVVDTKNRVVMFRNTKYNVSNLVKEVRKNDSHLPYLSEILMRQ